MKADRYTADGRDKINQLLNDERRTYKPHEISPNTGLEKQEDGTWAPPKNKENKSNSENKYGFEHGDVYKSKNGSILRVKKNGEDYTIEIKQPGKKTIFRAKYNNPKSINDYIVNWKATKIGNDPKSKIDDISSSNLSSQKSTNEKEIKATSTKTKPPLTAQTKITITPALKAELKKALAQPAAKATSEKSESSVEKPTVTNGFESYQGIKEIDKKLQPKWRQLRNKLKDSEYDAISLWQQPFEGDPYRDIQAYTRDPVNYTHETRKWNKNWQDWEVHPLHKHTKEQMEKTVKNLDSAFKKAPAIGTNLTVVSGQGEHSLFYNSWGIKERNTDKLAEALKKHIGETLTNKSYLSTTVNEKGAEGWHKTSNIEIRLDVPKDKKAIYLGNMLDEKSEYLDNETENELFINRGAKYRLDEVKVGRNRGGKKAVLVKMTLVGDGTEK